MHYDDDKGIDKAYIRFLPCKYPDWCTENFLDNLSKKINSERDNDRKNILNIQLASIYSAMETISVIKTEKLEELGESSDHSKTISDSIYYTTSDGTEVEVPLDLVKKIFFHKKEYKDAQQRIFELRINFCEYLPNTDAYRSDFFMDSHSDNFHLYVCSFLKSQSSKKKQNIVTDQYAEETERIENDFFLNPQKYDQCLKKINRL